MRPSRASNGGREGGDGGGGGGGRSGSFYSPQQYYGHQMPPRQQPQQQFGGADNGFYPPGGGARGFGHGQGWGTNAHIAGNDMGSAFQQQHGGAFFGHGYATSGPQQRHHHQQHRRTSYNDDRTGGFGYGDGSSRGGGGMVDHFSGPSGSHAHHSPPSRRRSPSPALSSEEREIRDLARAVDRDIVQRDRQLSIIWSKAHSDVLDSLLRAMVKADESASKKRAIEPLLQAFTIMVECRVLGRLDPSQKGRSGELKEDFVNGIYDLCEDSSDAVRKLGYSAIRELSRSDASLLKRNADVLVQLLQNEEPTEHDLIAKSLVGHLEQSPIEAFDVIIQDHCKGDLRHLALSFLATPEADKVLDDKVVGNADHEAALALRLADIIPLANDEEMELIKILLKPLSTLWLPSFDFATTEEYENASTSASRLLVQLVQGFLTRFRASRSDSGSGSDILKDQSGEIEKVLADSELLSPASGSEMQDAHELFKELLDVSTYEPASDATTASSAAVAYVKDVQKALRFVHKFLPDSTTTKATAPTLLRHLTGQLRILVLRFAAEVAGRAAVAFANAPPADAQSLNEDGKKGLARAAVAAINAIYPEEAKLPSTTGQEQAYEILLAEALLMVLVHAAPPTRTVGDAVVPEIDGESFKGRLRHLYGVSQQLRSSWPNEGEVKEAFKGVYAIAREYLKPKHLRAGVSVKPVWLQAPPPFPVAVAVSVAETSAPGSARPKRDRAETPPRDSKRSRASEVAFSTSSSVAAPAPVVPRPAPRGRGETQAPTHSDSTWDGDDLFGSCTPRDKTTRGRGGVRGFDSSYDSASTKRGITIRGGLSSTDSGMARRKDHGMSIRGAAATCASISLGFELDHQKTKVAAAGGGGGGEKGEGKGLSILGAARERAAMVEEKASDRERERARGGIGVRGGVERGRGGTSAGGDGRGSAGAGTGGFRGRRGR